MRLAVGAWGWSTASGGLNLELIASTSAAAQKERQRTNIWRTQPTSSWEDQGTERVSTGGFEEWSKVATSRRCATSANQETTEGLDRPQMLRTRGLNLVDENDQDPR